MLRVCIRAETSRSIASSSSVNRTAMKRRLLVVAEVILGARPFVVGSRFMLSSLACWHCWTNPILAGFSTVRLSITPRGSLAEARRSGCASGRSIVSRRMPIVLLASRLERPEAWTLTSPAQGLTPADAVRLVRSRRSVERCVHARVERTVDGCGRYLFWPLR